MLWKRAVADIRATEGSWPKCDPNDAHSGGQRVVESHHGSWNFANVYHLFEGLGEGMECYNDADKLPL